MKVSMREQGKERSRLQYADTVHRQDCTGVEEVMLVTKKQIAKARKMFPQLKDATDDQIHAAFVLSKQITEEFMNNFMDGLDSDDVPQESA